jgi:hypothetical protein
MSREINGHRVFGEEVIVKASNEEEARMLALSSKNKTDYWAWEAKELSPGEWEVYLAKHQDAFALND